MATKIFLNLPVKDLDKTVAFFTKLGFEFDPQYTDENATCMVISDDIYIMLLVEKYFMTFTKKAVADATKTTETIIAISAESRQAVDDMVRNALEAGGKPSNDSQDHGWMYGHSFQDVDGHLWEVLWLDPAGPY